MDRLTLLHPARAVCAGVIVALAACGAQAGGTPENILLIIDPATPASLHIGNYYKNARNIPDSNVLYMRPGAANYTEFKAQNQAAFLDTLAQRAIASQIDYVVIAATDVFFVFAPNLVNDECFPVNRFSVGSCYTLAQLSSTIVPGTAHSTPNQYFAQSDTVLAFDSQQGYLNGVANGSVSSRKYFISSLLGQTGPFGNTTDQIITLIDRSVAVDGTRPTGTFYYMNNTADGDRNVRQPNFAAAITSITNRTGLAQQLTGVLPNNHNDALGIMTGTSFFNFPAANVVIRPGAFCDHLTSYAATFDENTQTKCSAWVANGASGTAGTVEEPCNYLGKFPHPRFHAWYFQGMSLGESYLRSMQFLPFQNLLYGDPMTRPWARFPTVTVTNAPSPTVPVRGVITLSTSSAATAPAAIISSLELLVDGVSRGVITPTVTTTFTLDTRTLNDGWHDLRVLARDSNAARNMGRWSSSILVRNYGRQATLTVAPASGDLAQQFTFTPMASLPSSVRQVHLLQNGRIIAGASSLQPLQVYASNLGSGPSTVIAEVIYGDGRVTRSAPVAVSVGTTGTPVAANPESFNITRNLPTVGSTYVVELPGAYPDAAGPVNTFLMSSPTQATVLNSVTGVNYRFIKPNLGAAGQDVIQYRVVSNTGQSTLGTVTLRYTQPPICGADFNGDGSLDPDDLGDFINLYFSTFPAPIDADINFDGDVNPDDLGDYINAYFTGAHEALYSVCPGL